MNEPTNPLEQTVGAEASPEAMSAAMESSTTDDPGEGPAPTVHVFAGLPLYTTRLVREGTLGFEERTQLRTPAEVAAVLVDYFLERDREEFILVLLDTALTVIGLSVVSVGGLAASIVEPRQVFKTAILANAACVLCAHNHLSGNPEPSREDVRITKQLVEAGKLLGIPVTDHLIITPDGYVSFAERGLL